MHTVADDVAEVLRALAHPGRLAAMAELTAGEVSSGELARRLNVREPAMSQQLAVLRKRGLVGTRRDGQTIYYSIIRKDVSDLIRALYALYCEEPLSA